MDSKRPRKNARSAEEEGRVEIESTAGESGAEEELAAATPEERIRELEDRLQRTQAEFVNETKRIARQADDRSQYANENLLKDLLPVFDALHSAREGFAGRVKELAESGGKDDVATATALAALEGFELVERELLNVLGRHGVARIDATGTPFDPMLHHAIVMVDRPDLAPNTVAMELRPGFTLHGRVVRPAHVAVTADSEQGES